MVARLQRSQKNCSRQPKRLRSKVCNMVSLQKLATRSLILNLDKIGKSPRCFESLSNGVKSDVVLRILEIFKLSRNNPFFENYQIPYDEKISHAMKLSTYGPRWPKFEIPLHFSVLKRLINPSLSAFEFEICGGERAPKKKKTRTEDDLERLSKSCPNLKSVNLFNLKSLSIDGLGFLSTLPHLETIHLGWQYCSKSRETRASAKNALKIIPHLKEISQEEFNEEDFLTIPSTPQPTFSLEVLKMNATGSVENLAACVPNLKWVQLLLKYLIPPEVLSQLPYLSSFAMNCSDEREWPLVFNYLTVLGPRLTRLEVVDCMYAGENLYTILLLCPNLEYLNVEDPLGSTVQCAAKSIDFKKLKLRELHLVSLEVPLSRHQAYWPLLQAPELHTVTLHRFCFTYPKKVANIKGPLLQNLVNFECSFSKFASPAAFDHYIQFCICISHLAELPQVGKVLVHF